MIVCSCSGISDREIEEGLIEILNRPDAPIPTPGVVYRHLCKRMNCCGCAPLAVETIYKKVELLERRGAIPSYVCAKARRKLLAIYAPRYISPGRSVTVIAYESAVSAVAFMDA
jgi:hypothetical protein